MARELRDTKGNEWMVKELKAAKRRKVKMK